MANTGSVQPGPCSSLGCPPPTQIDCLEVTKVYDSCFQTENFPNLCSSIPEACRQVAEIPGATVSCEVTSSSCTFVSSTPTGIDDFANVTFAVSLTVTYTITPPAPPPPSAMPLMPPPPPPGPCSFSVPVNFVQTVTLCSPSGTTQTCTIAGTSCGPVAIINDMICGQLVVCMVFQSTATVQLLVPTYGFCTPSPCAVMGLPPCPPGFPSQCTPVPSSGGAPNPSSGNPMST